MADSGRVRVSLVGEDGGRESAPAVDFPYPLTDAELHEICWLLDGGYALAPFGEARARADRAEAGLRDLGRLMLEGVFRSGDAAAGLLDRAVAAGDGDGAGGAFRLAVVSERLEFLGLPWELLNAPEVGYLARRAEGVVRWFAGWEELPEFRADGLSDTQFNVLMVCPPGGAGIAGEALGAMESLEAEVSLECLRPASVDALEAHLSERGGYYHLIHLDGLDEGWLGEGWERVGRAVTGAGVPAALVCCAAPDYAHAAAAGLARAGTPEVALLPLPLGGAGRKLFADAFYAALAGGTGAAGAVSAARRAMMEHPHRPSAGGAVVSWDWIMPVVYQSARYAPMAVRADQGDAAGLPGVMPVAAPAAGPERQLPRGGPYGLLGRRREILELQEVVEANRVAVLSGPVGIGKSELALGLAAWLERSGGKPGGVFYTVFDVGAGLDKAVHEAGTALAGLEFGDLPAGARRRWLMDYLRDNDALLVWDGVENLAGFPDAGTGLLDDGELAELDGFLTELQGLDGDGGRRGGGGGVLLVSRRDSEPWLGTRHAVYGLGGLGAQDRVELATRLMEAAGVDAGRLGPEFGEALDLLEGHPLAMEAAVPLLKEVPASVLLGELRRMMAGREAGAGEEGRPGYFTAALDYAFSRMPRRSRTHLPFLSLFRSRVMMDILTHITQESVYRSVMGEQLGWGACRTLLRSARDGGFLEPVTPSVYQIHPAMGWFYGRALYRQLPAGGVSRLEGEFVRVYADTADYFMESLYENQDAGTTAILAEEGNLMQALGLALESGQWDNAQVLTQPLAQVYLMQKRYPELRRLRRQLLAAAGGTAADAGAKGAIELWLYLLGTEALECIETGELGRAEALNRELLDYFAGQPDGAADPRAAAVYHQMGEVALRRRELDQAEGWFVRSLAVVEGGDDRAAAADDYYGMGQVRQYQQRYTEAREWYSKSLEAHQRLEDLEEMVKDYRALGLCAQFRFEYQEAESWYHRAREALEEARDEEGVAPVYHALGTVAHAQYRFDDAENWYKQSLTLSDRMGNEGQMAVEFHYLGLVEQGRGMFPEDAEHWYRLALEKHEKLGDWRGAGDECRQLGVLFHEQGRLEEAEGWYHRAREVFEEIRDYGRVARTYGQLGMVAEERGDLGGALGWAARTWQLSGEYGLSALGQARAHLARLRGKYGAAEFGEWWRDFSGEEPPGDLDGEEGAIL